MTDREKADEVRRKLGLPFPDRRVRVDYCEHTIPPWAVEERCTKCHQRATHKIEETSGPANFHPLTAYLCCGCFGEVVTYDCRKYPYDTVQVTLGD